MTQGRIFTAADLKDDQQIECDVCVIGSGSGGAWLAHELVKAGRSVVMLEEGGYHTRREFDMTEARAFPNLYQELGNRSTEDLAITILQGRNVGGGTTINWCASFRTPDRILEHWKAHSGIETISKAVLTPHWDAIEKRLHIAEWPLEAINENNRILWNGLGKLGYERGLIKRNVNNCLNTGYCGMGCPVDAKQSMLVTMIPDAVEKGMNLYANTSARFLEWNGRRVEMVHAEVLKPGTYEVQAKLKVKAKVVCSSGGAINSPGLLMRSGLDAQGRVGRRTWLHPVIPSLAIYEQEVNAFAGAPQSVYSHQFIERGAGKVGFFLEVPPVHPMLGSIVAPGRPELVQEVLENLPHVNAMLAITVDGLLPEEEGATVRLKDGGYSRYAINYNFVDAQWEAFKVAMKEMARVQLAAGAKKVISLHAEPVVMTSEAEISKLDAAEYAPLRHKITTAHQMGGCAMGRDASKSVVDQHLKFHTMDNLFVVDGSVLPTSLGVNPQETIFGIARWAAQHIAASV